MDSLEINEKTPSILLFQLDHLRQIIYCPSIFVDNTSLSMDFCLFLSSVKDIFLVVLNNNKYYKSKLVGVVSLDYQVVIKMRADTNLPL